MKSALKFILGGVAAVGLGVMMMSKAPRLQAQDAETQQVLVPVVTSPTTARYKVIDIGQISVARGLTPAGTLEVVLNEQGAHGWRVVATTGSLVILSN